MKGQFTKMSSQTRPDIILIVLDTLRADRLSCYGYPRDTSPNIDAFAKSGVVFERAISPAQWTIPSHASIFTGEYPTTHMTTQIYDKHSGEMVMLAEALQKAGYQTIGFCNNPLLGVVENELDRGFEELYIYSGALPNRPRVADARPRVLGRTAHRVGRVVRRSLTLFYDIFARNPFLLRLVLSPWIAPLWQGQNFKGNTAVSLRDTVGYLRTRQHKGAERPAFVFINLMETHLPYTPPPRILRKFAPYYRRDRSARSFMQNYNREAYRWMLPMMEPLNGMQDRVLNDLYDAEVAYEDHMLRFLLRFLEEPGVRENTMVIITSDHGEGLNRHNFVGHSLVAYDDLVRVPLIIRYPKEYPGGQRISTPVSTRRIFHSALEAAGIRPASDKLYEDLETLNLAQSLGGSDPEGGIVFSEAYTPETLLTMMKGESTNVIEAFRCNQMRRAAYQGDYKLITVGGKPDELFDVISDPDELTNLINDKPELTLELNSLLTDFVLAADMRRPANREMAQVDLDEETIAERLRGLGYIE
jgi:arylsulfatase A-like enzyme